MGRELEAKGAIADSLKTSRWCVSVRGWVGHKSRVIRGRAGLGVLGLYLYMARDLLAAALELGGHALPNLDSGGYAP